MQQIGYLSESGDVAGETVDEVMVVPIFSTETGDVISALVVGFQPFELARQRIGAGIKSGIWLNGRLHLPTLSKSAQAYLGGEITSVVTKSDRAQSNFTVSVDGAPHLLFYGRLNPDSLFPPAYEICIYPLADLMARLHRLRWQIELLFKRLKSLLHLDTLPSRQGPTAKSWMLARFLAAALAQRLVEPNGPLSPWGYEIRSEQRPRSDQVSA